MKKYKYSAINLERKKYNGVYFANSEEHLRSLLAEQGLFLVSCKAIADKSPNPFFSLTGKISTKELTSFCRQLAIMISSSIELIVCLDILKNQTFSKYFKQVLDMVYEDVKSGLLLSQAMEKHKKIFPEFFRSMVYVGEMSSSLDKVLVNIADYYENESRTKSKVKSAMIYPITILVMMVGILALMVAFVIPTFRESLGELEVEMPGLTTAIFSISDFFLENWKVIALLVIGIIVAIKLFAKTKRGRYFFDTMYMKIGFLRKFQVAKVTAKFSRGFGLLLASGMNMVDSMEVIERVLGNKYVEKKFKQATEEVRKGVSLQQALENTKVFPTMLIQMVAVGEKTGSMDEVLLRTCDYFDEELHRTLSSITSMIQPVLMVVMGVLIAVMFVAVYSPMISIMEKF